MSKFKVERVKFRPQILLCPQIPKPMHGTAPRVVLGQQWWDLTRREAYRSTSYHCLACGINQGECPERRLLEGHELYDIQYAIGRLNYIETVPLCHYCHNYIHAGRTMALMEQGVYTARKAAAIMNHGDKVLFEAGLSKLPPYTGPMAWWGDWRLVVFGQLYEPIYKTEAEWKAHYGGLESRELHAD